MNKVQEVLQSAFDAINEARNQIKELCDVHNTPYPITSLVRYNQAIKDCKSALSDIEKCEPVAKVLFIQDEDGLEPHTFYSNDEAPAQEQLKDKFVIMDVYLVPQPSAWIGLSDDEIDYFMRMYELDKHVVKYVEAKLRELNTKG